MADDLVYIRSILKQAADMKAAGYNPMPDWAEYALAAYELGKAEAAGEGWRHAANEWADMATSGIQWIKNLRDKICTHEAALENMEECLAHCREVSALAAAPLPPRSGEGEPQPSHDVDLVREALDLIQSMIRAMWISLREPNHGFGREQWTKRVDLKIDELRQALLPRGEK
jgi:hypothetical protein